MDRWSTSNKRSRTSPSCSYVGTCEGVWLERGAFIIKEVAISFLNEQEVSRCTAVCPSWRTVLLDHEPLWTELLQQRYPNLRSVPLPPRGRVEFLRRVCVQKDPLMPVRPLAWPTSLKPSAQTLFSLWQPKVIVFLIDFWNGSVRLCSISHRVHLDKEGALIIQSIASEMGHKLLTVPDGNSQQVHCDESEDGVLGGSIEIKLSNKEGGTQALELLVTKIRNMPSPLQPLTRTYLGLSYYFEGGPNMPPHPPVFLLSEHASFWSMPSGYKPSSLSYRTDIAESWHAWPTFPLPQGDHDSAGRAQRALDIRRGFTARYGCGPLPFDPCVDICISTTGECWKTTKRVYGDELADGSFDAAQDECMPNDCENSSSLLFALAFHRGDEYGLNMRTKVLPALLLLYHDAIQQK